MCAIEGETCTCDGGEVKYGTNDADRNGNVPLGGRWTEWQLVTGSSIPCNGIEFDDDPARGTEKTCSCRMPDSSGQAGAADGLAYAQRPDQMSNRALGSQYAARAMDGPVETLVRPSTDGSLSACASICVSAGSVGYPFMGLQGSNQCFCGNTYNKRDGMPQLDDSECDINGDVTDEGSGVGIDCGMGLDSHTTGAANPSACVWRNAVYALSTQTITDRDGIERTVYGTLASPVYVGCFADSEGEFGEDITIGGNTFVDGSYGLTFDGEGDYAVLASPEAGSYATGGMFTITFYFSRSDCWIPGTFETLFAHQGINQPDFFDMYLSGQYSNTGVALMNTVEIYLGCADRDVSTVDGSMIRFLIADSVGSKASFDVPSSLEQVGGYVTDTWVHIALAVDHTSINAFIDGRPVSAAQLGFSPANYETNWGQTPTNLAYPNPSTLNAQLGTFDMAGGSDGPILGAARTSGTYGMREFEGSITQVTLWSLALPQDKVECLFTYQNQHIAICTPTSGRNRRWNADLTDGRRTPREIQLKKNAYLDSNGFGATFDGQDDFMAVSPAPRGFPGDDDFTISFWFTRTQCTVPAGDEYLYSQRQSWTGSRGRRGRTEDQGAEIDLVSRRSHQLHTPFPVKYTLYIIMWSVLQGGVCTTYISSWGTPVVAYRLSSPR